MTGIVIVLILVVVGIAAVLVVVGLRQDKGEDALETRMADFLATGDAASLEEIEMSQPFMERIVIPIATKMGELALRFTPQKALEDTKRNIELAGNPGNIKPTVFFSLRIVLAALFGVGLFFVFLNAQDWSPFSLRGFAINAAAAAFGFYMPNLWLTGRITARQGEVVKSLPDALDLLTICVEAGLGFESAMKKVAEKWDNELSRAFSRSLKEIQLGKVRREALRDMADRIGASELDSFVAAVIQSEQLGVSMAKILRIQADDMRIKRRQRAEALAQTAPIKMLLPMVGLVFPTIMITLMAPAAIRIFNSDIMDTFGG